MGDAPAEAPAPYPAVTALVFDALVGCDGVSSARGLDYVPMTGLFDNRVAVHTSDPQVRLLQEFTDDPARIRQGLRRILPTGTTLKAAQAERLAELRNRREILDTTGEAGAQAGAGGARLTGGAASAIGQTEIQKKLVQSELRTIQRSTRSIASSAGSAPPARSPSSCDRSPSGRRKTLVFFSEGLPASPALQAHLQSVVEAANRVNVTIYAVDASGLRAVSGMHDTRVEVEEAGKERLRQTGASVEPTDQPVMRIIEADRGSAAVRLPWRAG